MQPWEHEIPPVLYKYFPPARLHVLTDCQVRFSQRSVFDDEHELQPEYARFGTEDEIWRFVLARGIDLGNEIPAPVLIKLIVEDPRAQERAIEVARAHTRSADEFGLFCLTESADCEQMWREYAGDGKGFLIGFNTTQLTFQQLRTPGKIGKVSYSDEPFGTLLGTMETEGAAIFFRKRIKYAFEREWRSIRALHRLERRGNDVFLSQFDPASVTEIQIRAGSPLESDVQNLVTDGGYAHVTLKIEGKCVL